MPNPLDLIPGLGGGGGASASSDATIKIDGRLDYGLDDINVVTESTSKNDSTASLKLDIEPLDLKLEPIKADIDTNSVIDLKPVKADVDTNSVIDLKPIKADVDSNSVIDLKPVAVDSCQTIKLAPLPPIHIDQPYSHHFGFTFMGMELWGFTISGKSEMRLHSPGKQQHYSTSVPGHQSANKESGEEQSSVRPRSGLRVRLSD